MTPFAAWLGQSLRTSLVVYPFYLAVSLAAAAVTAAAVFAGFLVAPVVGLAAGAFVGLLANAYTLGFGVALADAYASSRSPQLAVSAARAWQALPRLVWALAVTVAGVAVAAFVLIAAPLSLAVGVSSCASLPAPSGLASPALVEPAVSAACQSGVAVPVFYAMVALAVAGTVACLWVAARLWLLVPYAVVGQFETVRGAWINGAYRSWSLLGRFAVAVMAAAVVQAALAVAARALSLNDALFVAGAVVSAAAGFWAGLWLLATATGSVDRDE